MRPADLPLPTTPRLAPGLRVVRRGRDQLQVGMYTGQRTVLARTPATEETLARLLDRQPVPEGPGAAHVLARLHEHGCLVDGAAAQADPTARRDGAVAILGRLPGADPAVLLEAAGAQVALGWTSDGRTPVAAVLVLCAGELDRDRLDPLIRTGTPHLVVRMVDGGAVVGPFAVAGSTACLRCVDAHLSVTDPAHVAVTARYAQATAVPRIDAVPDLADPTLVVLAIAWAVRDVAAYLDARRPSTWSRTVRLGPEPAETTTHDWTRHPTCACSWSPSEHVSGTMEA